MLERHLVERNRQAQSRDPAQQGMKDDLQFGTRELLTDALVPAVAEAELLAGVPAEIELVGLRVGLRIPVGRGQIDDDPVTGADGLAADLDVLQRHPALTGLDDGQIAHQFLDRVGDHLRILGISQEVGLLRVLQQGQDADPDHVGGGLVPGDQQTGAQLRGLFDADLPGGDPLGQVRHRVLGRVGLLLLDQIDQVLVQAHRALLHGVRRGVAGQAGVGVFLEELVVFIRDTEHFTDNHRRHR